MKTRTFYSINKTGVATNLCVCVLWWFVLSYVRCMVSSEFLLLRLLVWGYGMLWDLYKPEIISHWHLLHMNHCKTAAFLHSTQKVAFSYWYAEHGAHVGEKRTITQFRLKRLKEKVCFEDKRRLEVLKEVR